MLAFHINACHGGDFLRGQFSVVAVVLCEQLVAEVRVGETKLIDGCLRLCCRGYKEGDDQEFSFCVLFFDETYGVNCMYVRCAIDFPWVSVADVCLHF